MTIEIERVREMLMAVRDKFPFEQRSRQEYDTGGEDACNALEFMLAEYESELDEELY